MGQEPPISTLLNPLFNELSLKSVTTVALMHLFKLATVSFKFPPSSCKSVVALGCNINVIKELGWLQL